MSIGAQNIIIEKGKKLGVYQGAEILEWFVTADGYMHKYEGVCSTRDYIKRYVREGKILDAVSLLSPGLLYKSTPLFHDAHGVD